MNILSCEEFRYFWVSWEELEDDSVSIRFGVGQTAGQFELMFVNDHNQPIKIEYASVSAWHDGGAIWDMDTQYGK